MEKKRILLTGSNGFIGRSLLGSFDPQKYEIFALDCQNRPTEESPGVAAYFGVDITKPFSLNRDFDLVIHLAALNRTHVDSDFAYERFLAVNVGGVKNVLESCGFKRFIFFSTAHLYARNTARVDEDTPLNPVSYYERSKYEAELVCQKYLNPERLVILRPVNIAGTKQEKIAMLPVFFTKAVQNEPIEVFVPQNRRIQLLSVKDLFTAVEALCDHEAVYGTFNLAGSDQIEVRELARQIVKLCNSSSAVQCTNDATETFSEVVAAKAKHLLNWQAQDTISTIINDYARSFLAQNGSSRTDTL